MRDFDNKVAIVTGAAGGIGASIAARLSRDGAKLVLVDVDRVRAESVAKGLVADGLPDPLVVLCDVGRMRDAAACVDQALERFSRIDVLVNAAGFMRFKPLAAWTEDDWLEMLRVDLLGAAFFTQHAFAAMTNGGAIVNIASIHAVRTSPLVAPYAAAKAAMLSLTRSTALEGRSRGIRCNAVLPGAIDTPMLWANPNVQSGAEKIEPHDIGAPGDVAAAVAYLASDEARFVTGACLAVDGGRLAAL